MAIYRKVQCLIEKTTAFQVVHLFGHDTRNLVSIILSRKTLGIKRAGLLLLLLLRELESDILLIDWRTHGIVRAASSSGTATKHETRGQLGTTRRPQNLTLILLGESSEPWRGETLRESAAVVTLLLLAEASVTLDLALFVMNGIFGVLHHDTQVRSVAPECIVVISSTN